MKVCVPTSGQGGLNEEICGQFGCAPFFTVVDTDDGSVGCFANPNHDHAFGHCNPAASFGDRQIDALVVARIAPPVAIKLHRMGIRIFLSSAPSVREALELLQVGRLRAVEVRGA